MNDLTRKGALWLDTDRAGQRTPAEVGDRMLAFKSAYYIAFPIRARENGPMQFDGLFWVPQDERSPHSWVMNRLVEQFEVSREAERRVDARTAAWLRSEGYGDPGKVDTARYGYTIRTGDVGRRISGARLPDNSEQFYRDGKPIFDHNADAIRAKLPALPGDVSESDY